MDMAITIISVLIAAGACVATWVNVSHTRQVESERLAANHAEVMTKLAFLADDIKDVKADIRNLRDEINEVRRIAEGASLSAKEAHARLDRIGG